MATPEYMLWEHGRTVPVEELQRKSIMYNLNQFFLCDSEGAGGNKNQSLEDEK